MDIKIKTIVIFLFALLVICIAPFIGSYEVPFSALLNGTLDSTQNKVLYSIRIPRVILAFAAGAGLAICGVVFQAMFKNNLASPFTLGVSAASALGATIYFKFAAYFSLIAGYGAGILAFCFAFLSSIFILTFAHKVLTHDRNSVLLLGVALSFFCSSLVLFLQYTSNYNEMFSITRWLMGTLDVMEIRTGLFMLLTSVAGCFIMLLHSKELDIIAINDEYAQTRGVNVVRTNNILLLTSTFIVAVIVSICGIVGFVGIMVPHIARLIVRRQHFVLLIASFLLGGILLVISDTIARTVISPDELPVGIITSLLGAPFFIALLVSKR